MQEIKSPKEWTYDDKANNMWNAWSMEFPPRSVSDVSKQIVDELKEYIRPICIEVIVKVGKTYKESVRIKDSFINTSDYLSGDDIVRFYDSIVNVIKAPDGEKHLISFIKCQTFLTFNTNNGLVSEWFPSKEYYSQELIKNRNKYPLEGPIVLDLSQSFLSLTVHSDIWEPRFKNDQLAIINGERLTHLLKTINNIVNPTKMHFEGDETITNNFGYRKPEEIFPK